MNLDGIQFFLLSAHAGLKEFYNSGFFLVIKIVIGAYLLLLLANIVMLLFQRGLSENYRRATLGMDFPLELTAKKGKTRKRWNEIRRILRGNNESMYKVAIIEGDNFIDGILSKMGYPGNNMGERLDQIPSGHLENAEELKEAHKVRNRIIHEEDFTITREYAEEVLSKYEHFLHDHGVLD